MSVTGNRTARHVGVYVHFPWCLKKCPYCDFTSFAREPSDVPHDAYADAVIAELEARRSLVEGATLETVFFGGGTPSLWEPRALGRVIAAIRAAFAHHVEDVEITAECNPTSLDEDRARALIDAGVNRASVGVQSLDAERLRFLGRLHDPEGGLRAIADAQRAGMPRVSGDLIFGVAGGAPQSPEAAADEAGRVADTGVTHVSAYGLTIEPGTHFGELARRGRLPIASDEVHADSFAAVGEALAARGLRRYEVSNHARPGHEARHNLGTWRGQEYLGLGCGAVGMLRAPGSAQAARRYKNRTDPDGYVREATGRRTTEAESESLDAETRLRERIMLGLRLDEGLDLGEAARSLGLEAWTPERERAAASLVRAGQLEREGDRLRIPPGARVFTDGVAARLF